MPLGMMPGMPQIPGMGALSMGGSMGAPSGTGRRMTEGIPDPAAVQRQKETYARSLEDQLRKGVEVLAATHKQQTDLLHAQANQEKHRYNIALDQQVKQRELELSQQYNEQLMRLQQAAQVQRADLEQQACGMTLEYQQKKVAEEYMAQQQGIQRQHVEAQTRLEQDISKLMNGGITGVAPVMPGLLERVQANVRAGQMPLASYALPQAMGAPQAAPMPVAQSGMRPYVPPPGSMPVQMAPPQVRGAALNSTLGYIPQQQRSYVPSAAGSAVAAPGIQPIRSYVPPTGQVMKS